MSEAYDRLDWKFLKTVLIAMNFSPRWVRWIMECVSTVQYTFLVNGGITQSFTPSKGLRQGDPISPYLFLMCANILSLSFLKVEQNKDSQGIKIGRNGSSFTHLFFLLMTPSFSLRTINPLKICNISFTGTVLYQGNVLTLQNLTYIVLPI